MEAGPVTISTFAPGRLPIDHTVDEPGSTVYVQNDEFDDGLTRWDLFAVNAGRHTESRGVFRNDLPVGGTAQYAGPALTTATTYTLITKVGFTAHAAAYAQVGLCLHRAASNKQITIFALNDDLIWMQTLTAGAFTANIYTPGVNIRCLPMVFYIKVQRTSATAWTVSVGPDGNLWYALVTGYNMTTHLGGAPDTVMLHSYGQGSFRTGTSWFWYRVT